MSGDLGLPPPPLSVRFSASEKAAQAAVCYVRKGTPTDAGPSLCGKGGFGCAYRYKRVDEFTPPSSYDPEEHTVTAEQSPFRVTTAVEQPNEEAVERLRSADGPARPLLATKASSASLRRTAAAPASGNPPPVTDGSEPRSQTNAKFQPLKKAPSVLVAKVCRTPETGSFDELARCGALKREARDAERRLSRGDASGEHTRIVRGEARLLRYLQSAYLREYPPKDGKTINQPIVRLLADTECPVAGSDCPTPDSISSFATAQELAEDGAPMTPASPAVKAEEEEEPSAGEPPPVRLLFFERLIDLDARLTSSGWVRDRNMWTMDAVEQAALEIVSGLAFLHSQGVAHADVKPANLMRDAKTGQIKLLDFGASRRWVRLPNSEKENTKAVDALDSAVAEGRSAPQQGLLCEGLGSLTGTPHHCAPEVLLQACRYASADGWSRSTISDYAAHPRLMPPCVDLDLFAEAALEFDRGWGIKADIWSWGCTVLSLLGRTDGGERTSTSTVCPFDFSFDRLDDALEPLHELSDSEKTLPRFHMWARCFPTRITAIFRDGVVLPPKVAHLSPSLQGILRQTFCQQDIRPSAQVVCEALTRRRSPVLPRRGSAQQALMAPALDGAARPASPRSVASVPLPASPASSFSSRTSRLGMAGVWQQQSQMSYGTTQSGPVPPSPSVAVASISMHSANQPMTLQPNRYSISEGDSESGDESALGDSTALVDPGHSNTDLLLGTVGRAHCNGDGEPGHGAIGALQLEPGEPVPPSPGLPRSSSRTNESMPMEGLEGPGARSSLTSSSVGGFLTKLRRNSINMRRRWHNASGGASPGHSPAMGATGEADVNLVPVPSLPTAATVPLPASLPGSPPTLAHRSSSRQLRWTMRRAGAASSTALDSSSASSVGHSPVLEPAQLPPPRPARQVDRSTTERHVESGAPARDRSSTITPGSAKREQQPGIPQHGASPGQQHPFQAGGPGHEPWYDGSGQPGHMHTQPSASPPPAPQPSSPHGLKQKLSMVFNRSGRKRGATVTRASVQSG